jgi:glutaminase
MRFNSIVSVEQSKKWRRSGDERLVNPGAITATSMVQGATRRESGTRSSARHSDCAGAPLKVLKDVYESEAATNQRNQAIGMLMYAYEYIKENPMQASTSTPSSARSASTRKTSP